MIGVPENPFIWLLLQLLNIYWWIVLAAVVMSWLIAFGVLNTYNPFARSLIRGLEALTEPVFRPIRRILPAMGGLDLSPLIVLVGIIFLEKLIIWLELRYLYNPGV